MTGAAVFDRITFEPGKMGGRACIRRMRITVSTIFGLVAEGETAAEILKGLSRPRAGGHPPGPCLRRLAHARGGDAGLSPCAS